MFGRSHEKSPRCLSERMGNNYDSKICVLRRHSINSCEAFEIGCPRDIFVNTNKVVSCYKPKNPKVMYIFLIFVRHKFA